MKIVLDRETLHQLARGALGERGGSGPLGNEPISNVTNDRVRIVAKKLADATAVRGPVEIEIID